MKSVLLIGLGRFGRRMAGKLLMQIEIWPSVGITLTSADDGRTVFIPPTEVMPNEPKTLYFILPPEVTPGLWTLRVSTQYRSRNRLTQTPRTDEQHGPKQNEARDNHQRHAVTPSRL